MFTLIFIKLEVQSLYIYDSMSFHKNHCMSDIYSFFFFFKGLGVYYLVILLTFVHPTFFFDRKTIRQSIHNFYMRPSCTIFFRVEV